MFDVVTYALVKKMIGQAATGISKVEYKDGALVFTLADGSTISTPLDISSGVAGAHLTEDGALVIEFSDGPSLTYAAASKEDLQKLEEKVSEAEKTLSNLTDSHNSLQETVNTLQTTSAVIDNNMISNKAVWSSQKTIDALTIEESVNGTNKVIFDSIGGTRPEIKTTISNAPIQILASLNGEQVVNYLTPINGTYYLNTGLFILEDGTETRLDDHNIIAAQGTNTFEIVGVDSVEVTYKTIPKQSGGSVDFNVINGGSAKEEA